MKEINIRPLPALQDNYIWLIEYNDNAIVIDPSESQAVLGYLAKNYLNLTAILLTHNHSDHTNGVNEIIEHYPAIPVFGSFELKEFANQIISGGDYFELDELVFDVIESGGHTAQHVSYLLNSEYLFCGDSLFSGGCGRVFTGDYEAQFNTLQRFKALPDFVKVYPAHEYTQNNMKFAESILLPSCTFFEYQEHVDILCSQHQPTLPTTIQRERQINPFMQEINLSEFITLRKKRDEF